MCIVQEKLIADIDAVRLELKTNMEELETARGELTRLADTEKRWVEREIRSERERGKERVREREREREREKERERKREREKGRERERERGKERARES